MKPDKPPKIDPKLRPTMHLEVDVWGKLWQWHEIVEPIDYRIGGEEAKGEWKQVPGQL